MAKRRKRNDVPQRFRAARKSASVRTIESDIERAYGLPRGSVGLKNPDGSDARSDKKIGKLLGQYEESE